MKETSRRQFLSRSLLAAGSVLFLPGASSLAAGIKTRAGGLQARSYPSYLKLFDSGALKERVRKLKAYYENCTLCPRDCRVDRTKAQVGKCQATATVRVSSAFPHFGEERPLVGRKGSGTIFFSHCGLRCVYCQNYNISFDGEGIDIPDERLAASMLKIQQMGCHNINLVTPTHYVPNIVNAILLAVPSGLKIPIVYNTSGYEKLEVLQLLDGIVDIYLPDFKYMDPENASKYSSEAFNYPHYARIAFKEMFRQVGDLKVAGGGIAQRGLMVRHLVLPNRIAGTKELLRFIATELSQTTYINIMRQYRPEYKANQYPELNRRITRQEYSEALKWARELGLTRLD